VKRLWFASFTLPLTALIVGAAWLLLTEGGLNWVYLQLRDQPGLRLDIERVEGSLAGGVKLSNLLFDSDAATVELQSLEFELSPLSLLVGVLDVRRLALGHGDIELPPSAGGGEPFNPDAIELNIPLRRITVERLRIDELELVQGEWRQRINRLDAGLELDSGQLSLVDFELQTPQLKISSQGQAAFVAGLPFDLTADWQVTLPGLPELVGAGRVHGDLHRIRLEQTLQAPSNLRLTGEVTAPLDRLSWQARVQLKDFESKHWGIDGPLFKGSSQFEAKGDLKSVRAAGSLSTEHEYSGPLSADFDLGWGEAQRLEVHTLKVKSGQSDSQATARGWWRPGEAGGELDLDLTWVALRWPLDAAQTVWSPAGRGSLRGTLDDYRFEVESNSPLQQLPDARLAARGRGTADNIEFSAIELHSASGRLKSSGRLDWKERLSWQAISEASDVDPTPFAAQWPGKLSLKVEHRGAIVDGQAQVRAEIKQAMGELRGYPVSLRGDIEWTGHGLRIHEAVFHSAESRIDLSGHVNEELALDWRIDSPRLNELYADVRGSLKASGRLFGTREQPRVQAALDARELAYAAYSAQRIDGNIELDVFDPAGLQGSLVARELAIAGSRWQRVQLQGDSSSARLSAANGELSLELAVAGKLQAGHWQGRLLRADIDSASFGDWRLVGPAALSLSSDWRPALDEACWHSDASRLCAAVARPDKGSTAQVSLNELALRRLQPWLPDGLVIEGTAAARGDIEFVENRLLGSARVDLSPGRLAYPIEGGDADDLQHQGGHIELKADTSGVQATALLTLNEQDHLRARLALPGADLLTLDAARQKIDGRLDATVEHLSLIGEMIPEVQRLTGRLQAGIRLSGLLADPAVGGTLSLVGGRLEIPRLGLTVSEISMQADTDNADRVSYRLQAKSGEGRLVVAGNAQRDAEGLWSTDLSIDGRDVEVSHIPEAQVLASPALKVRVRPNRVDLSGRIEIPYAHIEPRDITSTARVSNDVVIVGEEKPKEQPWQIHSRVQLVLGDRVHFLGFGLEGRLNGQVQVEESPGLPTRGSGEISIVDGRYRAYGQRLDIEQGRLLFSGGPLASPGVDARAVRKVGSVTAGVRARGQIQAPVIELFSSPAMGQTEILSYLLLGRPIDKASESDGAMMAQAALALGLSGGDRLARNLRDRFGLDEMRVESSDSGDQASLVVGRYLSPRLYVSYGIGLVEAFNTLVVRYDISDKWQLKAESGEAHGADLIYTIER
jgi:translocation and assembly module TamB